jgi:mannan endo-1,4-beta-mannosidase
MRKLVLAALLVGVAAIPAQVALAAPMRVLGFSGTPSTYTALSSLHPSVHADFLAFGTSWAPFLAQDTALQATPMITWEPWNVSLQSIASGADDAYLSEIAAQVAAYPAPVYIRFAHEMNGNWYPWGAQPAEYVAAWRHLWNVFQAAGATRAQWVWAPDLIAGLPRTSWRREVAAYWPGAQYVNIVGTSLVTFAFQAKWPLSYRFASIDWLRTRYRKPVWLAEVKVDSAQRYPWLRQLAAELASRTWVTGLIWSETPSTAQERGDATGNMNWALLTDPKAARLLGAAVAS